MSLTAILTRKHPGQPAQGSKTRAGLHRRPVKQEQDGETHHPPTSLGKNNVSSAVGSNDRIRETSPAAARTAAVKPSPVSCLNRSSALATACASLASK